MAGTIDIVHAQTGEVFSRNILKRMKVFGVGFAIHTTPSSWPGPRYRMSHVGTGAKVGAGATAESAEYWGRCALRSRGPEVLATSIKKINKFLGRK